MPTDIIEEQVQDLEPSQSIEEQAEAFEPEPTPQAFKVHGHEFSSLEEFEKENQRVYSEVQYRLAQAESYIKQKEAEWKQQQSPANPTATPDPQNEEIPPHIVKAARAYAAKIAPDPSLTPEQQFVARAQNEAIVAGIMHETYKQSNEGRLTKDEIRTIIREERQREELPKQSASNFAQAYPQYDYLAPYAGVLKAAGLQEDFIEAVFAGLEQTYANKYGGGSNGPSGNLPQNNRNLRVVNAGIESPGGAGWGDGNTGGRPSELGSDDPKVFNAQLKRLVRKMP